MELITDGLSKVYKNGVRGLSEFTISIPTGIVGLVGPNGAGKSTLMRILATVTRPTAGKAFWDGVSVLDKPDRVRAILGYLPQDFGVYPNLNAVEFLTYLAAARGIGGKAAAKRIHQLLDIVNLGDARKRRLGSLSGGMKQRVGVAQALLNDPQLLIVDEPTAGLDPEERIRFRNLLGELSGDRVVLLSSHIVSDIEAAANTIAVMNHGRLLTHTLPSELMKSVEGRVWEVAVNGSELEQLKKNYIISNTVTTSNGVKVRVIGDKGPSGSARAATPTLEDAYLLLLALDRNGRNDE